MLPFSKACILLAIALGVQFSTAGAVMSVELSGGEVETVQIVLSYFGLLALGVTATIFAFLYFFLKRWNPKNLDPITVMMVDKIMRDTNTGPVIERIEAIEKELTKRDERDEILIRVLSEVKAGITNQGMGSGELYLRTKPAED